MQTVTAYTDELFSYADELFSVLEVQNMNTMSPRTQYSIYVFPQRFQNICVINVILSGRKVSEWNIHILFSTISIGPVSMKHISGYISELFPQTEKVKRKIKQAELLICWHFLRGDVYHLWKASSKSTLCNSHAKAVTLSNFLESLPDKVPCS